jgi:HPr Serine kinase C-terminal domain
VAGPPGPGGPGTRPVGRLASIVSSAQPMASFHFRAFGLRIESDTPIAGLPVASAAPADLRIHMGSLPPEFDAAANAVRAVWRSDDDADAVTLHATGDDAWMILAYADGTRFAIRPSGSEIWAVWPDSGSAESTATYLLGPVIGFALRLRGLTCFHASCVVIEDHAILLAGPAGIGKSSTAAALALRGHRVIGDDIAVVEARDDRWVVYPAVPGVRLWDDMVDTLMGRPDALPLMAAGWEKRQLDLRTSRAGFSADTAFRLGAIYLLESTRSASPPAERLTGRDALVALVGTTYANVLLSARLRRAEFLELSALVQQVPVWRVVVPEAARGLAEFCVRIEAAGASTGFAPGTP